MRVLVIGHGLIGQRRAKAIMAIDDAVLAGTVDKAERDPDAYGAAPHYWRLEDVPTESYDAAVIALPHHLGHAYAVRCLFGNKPVLIEKPLGRNSTEAHKVLKAATNCALPSFVGYNYRFLPHIERAFKQAREGRLGKLRAVDILLGHGGHPGSADGWKLDPKLAGGGVLIDPGVHAFDLLLNLDPDLLFTHVGATRGFWKTGIEEDATVSLASPERLANVRVSHVRWVNTFRVEIFGEAGYAICEGRGGHYGNMTLRSGERWGWQKADSQAASESTEDFGAVDSSFDREMQAVIDRWMGKTAAETAPATLAEGLRVAELVDEMYAELGESG